MTNDTVLIREESIPENVDPFGNKWGVMKDPKGWGMTLIGIIDDKGKIRKPEKYPEQSGLDGMFTKPEHATKAIVKYLHVAWDWNDAQQKRNAGAARKRTANEEAAKKDAA